MGQPVEALANAVLDAIAEGGPYTWARIVELCVRAKREAERSTDPDQYTVDAKDQAR